MATETGQVESKDGDDSEEDAKAKLNDTSVTLSLVDKQGSHATEVDNRGVGVEMVNIAAEVTPNEVIGGLAGKTDHEIILELLD